MTTTTGLPRGSTITSVGPVRLVVHLRPVIVNLVLTAGLALLCLVYLGSGQIEIPYPDVARHLAGSQVDNGMVIEVLRLPRLCVAVLGGVGLGLAGALVQSVVRNPLASPDVIGVTHGASAAVVAVYAFGLAAVIPVQAAALTGGLAAALLVYLLAWRGGLDAARFLLIGIGIAAGLSALGELLLTRGDFVVAEQAKVWTVGSLNGLGWSTAGSLLAALLVLLPLVVWAARALPSAAYDDTTVTALGGRPAALRGGLALLGIALAAASTAAVGPINFVALLAPQLARLVAGRPTIPLTGTALIGAIIVVGSDLLGRTLFLPVEVPAGVLTAIIGAPYLLWLVFRRKGGLL
jgi:iron complex transport system permease protein